MHSRSPRDRAQWLLLSAVAFGAAILLALQHAAVVQAHAVLERSEPAANAILAEPPAAIDLWFSEPLEPNYSKITLRDGTGALVTTPPSAVDASDAYHLSLPVENLGEGIYTVVWQVVSAADGHTTSGSFPISLGVTPAPAAVAAPVVAAVEENLPIPAAAVRWFNLLALALGCGAVAFAVLVWRPAQPDPLPLAERRMRLVMLIGWALMGIAGLLILWLQIASATQAGFGQLPTWEATQSYLLGSRYGALWLWRMVLWVCMGGLLLWVRRPWAAWAALFCAAAILALTSLFSHAGAAQSSAGAVVADWLHLLMAAVWIGGLAQLAAVTGPLRASTEKPAAATGNLVGRFSNVARVAVLAIVISGAVALWLQVGSLAGLLDTLYGRVLAFKLLLLVPLLAIAAINLVVTHNRLRAGQAVWIGRLRLLVGLELGILALVLLATGALTAMNPARNVLVERANAEAQAAAAAEAAHQAALAAEQAALEAEQAALASAYSEMQMVDDLHVTLTIQPGWAGENNFSIALNTMDGDTITDASLIRMRFENMDQDLGESELRIGPHDDGVYTVQGANLSVPGPWKIRVSVQRPDQFDAVVDFMPTVQAPPR